jgi:hypothetical protein
MTLTTMVYGEVTCIFMLLRVLTVFGLDFFLFVILSLIFYLIFNSKFLGTFGLDRNMPESIRIIPAKWFG